MKLRVILPVLLTSTVLGQVTYDRILHADREPQNWLTYGGNYSSLRYSQLTGITPQNAKDLELKFVWRPRYLDKMEATPLVVDGVLYTVQNSEVVAMDAENGRVFWTYRYAVPPESNAYLMVVKGLGISGNTLVWPTYNGHLIAIDAKSGHEIWNKVIFDYKKGYQFNVAPLIVHDKIILGPATNERGANCWVGAYDIKDGHELWRFWTAPNSPDDPAAKSWELDSGKHGGSPIWVTGSYDPDTNLTFWGTGNPNPGWNGDPRPGDNLYADSVVAVDADTGKLKWYFQFTPHDEFDWDSVQVPVLANIDWKGKPTKVMMWANRNGVFYVLDRTSGKFLFAKPFVKTNWVLGFDEGGRPIKNPALNPKPMGFPMVEPGTQGGTNWYSPSFSPRTGLFYASVWDNYSGPSGKTPMDPWIENKGYSGRSKPGALPPDAVNAEMGRGGRGGGGRGASGIGYRKESEGFGAIRAIDPATGEKKWDFKMNDWTEAGVLTTGADVLFGGGREGTFVALDARNGNLLWHTNLGGTVTNGPITYAVNGHQYVAASGDNALFVFGLPQ